MKTSISKLEVNSKGIYVNGRRVSSLILDRIKGLRTYTPSPEEIPEIGPETKLVIGDKVVINLPAGQPVIINLGGNVYGRLDISSCQEVNIAGNMKGDVDVASGNVKVAGDVDGNISGGALNVEIGGDVSGEVKVSGGTIKFGK